MTANYALEDSSCVGLMMVLDVVEKCREVEHHCVADKTAVPQVFKMKMFVQDVIDVAVDFLETIRAISASDFSSLCIVVRLLMRVKLHEILY